MVKLLTDAAVRKYAPGPNRRRIRDAGARSLFLIIEPSGAKSWQMRFRRPDGKPGKLTLGSFDASGRELSGEPTIGMPLSLAAARQLAAWVHRERKLGRDVIAEHKARRHRQRAEAEERKAGTFSTAAQDFIARHARPNTRNWIETARLLGLRYQGDGAPEVIKGSLAERWAETDVRAIDGHDIWSVVDDARERGVPGLGARNTGRSEARARMLYVALSSMFTWLQRQRRVEVNPCKSVARPAPARVRERVLTPDEVVWFWRACDTVGEPFAAIFRLLLLTGARLNEVAGMRRSELRDDGTWHLPGSRTKNKRPHVVPLPPSARDLIPAGKYDLPFTSTAGRTPVSGWSRAKRRLDVAMLKSAREDRGANAVIAPWRLHDLRRTTITGMGEMGVPPHVIELVINHISGHKAGVAGTYNRSEMLPERKVALERWAAHLAGLVSDMPLNVVRLPHREPAA